jgi:hypothetical protein
LFGSINGELSRGSITLQEAKCIIYKDFLGFKDITNFDRVRKGYRGGPVVIFKLKDAINLDQLLQLQHFGIKRKASKQCRTDIDIISCTIPELRKPVKPDYPNQKQMRLLG